MKASPEDIATIRAALTGASDEQLEKFLTAYTLGTLAGFLIEQMSPAARWGFFASMRGLYPEARGENTVESGSN